MFCVRVRERSKIATRLVWRGGLPLLLVGLFVVGCAKKPNSGAEVTGKVTYKGKDVETGTVSFVTKDGAQSAPIIKGMYKMSNAPIGQVEVGVAGTIEHTDAKKTANHPPGAKDRKANPAATRIPSKLMDPKQSGLPGFEIKKGKQQHDITIS
jgi:hypothetical protein